MSLSLTLMSKCGQGSGALRTTAFFYSSLCPFNQKNPRLSPWGLCCAFTDTH
jgi:hypothetical protein